MSTDMIWETYSTSSAETERLGLLLGKKLKGGEVIELRSDLGGGKTTFVKGLVKGTGSKGNVASPTFTLNRVYKAKKFDIFHFDFYRLDDPGILRGQLAESIKNSQAVTVVEWAGIVADVLPARRIAIEFKLAANDPDERQVSINYPEKFEPQIKSIQTQWREIEP